MTQKRKKTVRGKPLKQSKPKDCDAQNKIIERWEELCNYIKCFATKDQIILMLGTNQRTLDRAIKVHTEELFGESKTFKELEKMFQLERKLNHINGMFNTKSEKMQIYVYEEFIKEKEEVDDNQNNTSIIAIPFMTGSAQDFNSLTAGIDSQKQLQESINKQIEDDGLTND